MRKLLTILVGLAVAFGGPLVILPPTAEASACINGFKTIRKKPKGSINARTGRITGSSEAKLIRVPCTVSDPDQVAGDTGNPKDGTSPPSVSRAEYKKLQAERQKKIKSVIAHNKAATAAINACFAQSEAGGLTGTGLANCVTRNRDQKLPGDIDVVVARDPVPGQVTLTPQEVAYQAVATLELPAPKPGIGPPPSINRWKMAAVGYPLWLWGDGNLNPGRVSSRVANLSVALDARVEKIVFTMGDGQSVSCTAAQAQHPWHRGIVRPGTPSPYCGYRYTKPSLPRGKYTVSAYTHYRIDWELNGETGSEEYVPPPTTVQLPVGELQVTVR